MSTAELRRVGDLSAPLTENSRAVLRFVLLTEKGSRAAIAAHLGLSRPTLTRIARELIDAGFLVDSQRRVQPAMGRPSEVLVLREDARHFLGIKITGTHLYSVVTDMRARTIRSGVVELHSTAVSDVVDQVAQRVAAEREVDPLLAAVGVCLGGRFRYDGPEATIVESQFLGWADVPLWKLLSERFNLPLSVDNDVHALTAAEHWFGDGRGTDSFVVVTLGVGIGCGMVIDGELVSGFGGAAGRVSHIVIDPAGPTCPLGHHGCATAYITNDALASAYSRKTGASQTHAHLVSAARSGDPTAVAVVREAAHALGVLVGTAISVIDPELILLTGDGIAVAQLAYAEVLAGAARTGANAVEERTEVRTFDFDEWARGAAACAIRHAWLSPAPDVASTTTAAR